MEGLQVYQRIFIVVLFLSAGWLLFPPGDGFTNTSDIVELESGIKNSENFELVHLFEFGGMEQDIYLLDANDDTKVFRVKKENIDERGERLAPLYKSAEPVPHDYSFTQSGPFLAGEPMDLIALEWMEMQGQGSYACSGDKAAFAASFRNLVKNGSYSLWTSRSELQNNSIISQQFFPLGKLDASDNFFRADSKGNIEFFNFISPCLEESARDITFTGTYTGIWLFYHSNNDTVTGLGDTGKTSHAVLMQFIKAKKI